MIYVCVIPNLGYIIFLFYYLTYIEEEEEEEKTKNLLEMSHD